MDNYSLKNKNETKKEECFMICAEKANGKMEKTLKWLNFPGIKYHVIWYNPWYYIQRKFWLSSTKLSSTNLSRQEKKKISGFEKYSYFLEIINLTCFSFNSFMN